MLQEIIDWIFYTILVLDKSSLFISSLNYFVYDTIKIILLLFFLITGIGFIRTYIPQEKIRQLLTKSRLFSNFIASIFGAITPFCSCSSIPIFIGLIESGVPLGAAFSFLVTSPIINEYLVVLMLGFFGWKITILYVIGGILIGTLTGTIFSYLKVQKYLVKDIYSKDKKSLKKQVYKTINSRILFGINEALSITKKLWLWIIIAVAIGAIIHNYVPESLIQSLIKTTGFFSVPIATIIGVPMYGSCAALVPVAVELFNKGVPLGTALAFMLSVSALSFPEAIMLRRVMKLQLILMFFGIVTLIIIFTGYLFNLLQGTIL